MTRFRLLEDFAGKTQPVYWVLLDKFQPSISFSFLLTRASPGTRMIFSVGTFAEQHRILQFSQFRFFPTSLRESNQKRHIMN